LHLIPPVYFGLAEIVEMIQSTLKGKAEHAEK